MVKYRGMKNVGIAVNRESGRSRYEKVSFIYRPFIGSFSV
jgi:hypothetical protein